MYKNLVRAALAALSVSACLLAAAATKPVAATLAPPKSPLKVAFVYVSPIGNAGWTYQHNQGRLAMENKLGDKVKTIYIENVAEGPDAERVMRDLAAHSHQLIFATSFGYMEPALRVARDFPGVAFEHMGGYKTAPNLNTYNARFYEGRYLAGMVAGRMSKTGTAGYVAGFPIPEVIQGINAFTLGMRVANPKAQVKVLWLNTWFDPAKEREAALSLVNEGVDTLTYHSGSTAVPALAEEKGVMLLGYQSDMRDVAPKSQLTSVTHDWGAYYTSVVQAVIAGKWKVQPFWGGVREHVIRMAPFSPRVPADVQHQIVDVERSLAAGRLHPFSGRIVDQAGKVRQSSGRISDADLMKMDYFVQGVVGTLPAAPQ